MSAIFTLARNGQLTEATLTQFLRTGKKIDEEENGRTLLGEAAWNGHPSVVEILLRQGANVNKGTRHGQTPLHYAAKAKRRRQETIQALVEGKADLDAQDDDGNTPLMVAITQQPDPAVVKLLVAYGASTTTQNEYGKTAKDLAGQSTTYAMDVALLPEGEQPSERYKLVDCIVQFVLFILAYVNSGLLKDVTNGVVSKLYNINIKPHAETAQKIGNPTTIDDFKHNIQHFVTHDKPELRHFFPPGDDFLQKVAEKAVQLSRDDPTNHLNDPRHINDLTKVALYQTIFYCDDSRSMRDRDTRNGPTRQELLRKLVTRMTGIATRLVPDDTGVHLRFINRKPAYSSANDNLKKEKIDAALKFEPDGSTKIGTELRSRVLKPFLFDMISRGETLKRPILVIVITDGEPTEERPDSFKEAIIECGRALAGKGYEPEAVRFLVSRVGYDENAVTFLNNLRGDAAIERVVHCTSGPLDQRFQELHRNEKYLEQWLLQVLMSPITGISAR